MDRYESFQSRLSEIIQHPVSKQDAAEAFHNLSGFMSLLIKINEREHIIPTKPPEL